MPDWRALVRARLARLELDPIDELNIAEEIGQHFEDRFAYLQSQGWSESEATELVMRELDEQTFAEHFSDLGRD
ncbi:MAG: hypothetical protein DIU54_006455 [Acidobacteriota bacterium]|jgi:hypothetical protein|nr:MAG: hypothetical protein DIU54_13045 [Acidobacteriota bacterium]